jgi:hypothetical protein
MNKPSEREFRRTQGGISLLKARVSEKETWAILRYSEYELTPIEAIRQFRLDSVENPKSFALGCVVRGHHLYESCSARQL